MVIGAKLEKLHGSKREWKSAHDWINWKSKRNQKRQELVELKIF